jgi:hypothetical protein
MAWMRAREARNPPMPASSNKRCEGLSIQATLSPDSLLPPGQACREHAGRHRAPRFSSSTTCWLSVSAICHHRAEFASLGTLATSCGWPREIKACRQSAAARVTYVEVKHLDLDGGEARGSSCLFCPSRIQVAANLNLLRTSSSISGAKAINLTSRHPMDNSHVAGLTQRPVPVQDKPLRSERKAGSKLDVRGANTADERHW